MEFILVTKHDSFCFVEFLDYETIDITETEPTIPRILTFVATSDSLTKYPDPDFLKRWEEIAAPNVNSSSVTSNFNHPKIEVNINNNQNNDQNEKENKIPVIRDDYEMTSKLGLKRPYSWDDNNGILVYSYHSFFLCVDFISFFIHRTSIKENETK